MEKETGNTGKNVINVYINKNVKSPVTHVNFYFDPRFRVNLSFHLARLSQAATKQATEAGVTTTESVATENN